MGYPSHKGAKEIINVSISNHGITVIYHKLSTFSIQIYFNDAIKIVFEFFFLMSFWYLMTLYLYIDYEPVQHFSVFIMTIYILIHRCFIAQSLID